MNFSKITSGRILNRVLSRLDPLSKDGPLLIQSLINNGYENVVKEYENEFLKEEKEEG
jgi:hypothetical protein